MSESLLDLLFDPTKDQRPHRILLYGVPGIGKSTWATRHANSVVIPTEDGLRNIQCTSMPLAKDFATIGKYLEMLATSEHDRKVLVIDSADWLEKLINKRVAEDHSKTNFADIGYGKGPEFAAEKWQGMLEFIETEINIKREMTVILVAHSHVVKYNAPETDSYDRYSPRLHKYAAAVVQEWADEVLFVNRKVYTTAKETGFKTTVKATGGIERVMYTTEKPSHMAKNRLNLPDEMPFEWSALAQKLPCLIPSSVKDAK